MTDLIRFVSYREFLSAFSRSARFLLAWPVFLGRHGLFYSTGRFHLCSHNLLFYSTGRFHLCSRDLLFYWVCSIVLFYWEVAFMQSRSIILLGLFYCSILLGGFIHAVTIYCSIECFQSLIPLSGSNFLILNGSRVSSAAIASKQKSLISRLL